jgi:hypothetical protein
MDRINEIIKPACNTGFASGGVTCKLGTLCFYSSSVLADSLVLRNPPERKARNRSPDIAFGSSGERTEDYILHSTPRLTATS